MTNLDDVRAGKFTAVFARGEDAKAFYDRLSTAPAADLALAGSVKLNRKGGRQVSWQAATEAFQAENRDEDPDGGEIFRYWQDMAETVGYYGSTFGEPRPGLASAPHT